MVFSRLTAVSSRSDHYQTGNGNNSAGLFSDKPVTPGVHPIELSIRVESPPCVMYGNATESSGALLNGLLNLTVKDPYKKNNNQRHGSSKQALSSTSNSTLRAARSSGAVPLASTASTTTKRKSGLFTTLTNLSMSPAASPSSSTSTLNSGNSDTNSSNNNNINSDINKHKRGAPTKSATAPAASNLQIIAGYTKLSITSVTLSLIQKIHYHKPFLPENSTIASCMNCKNKLTNMKTWEIQKDTLEKAVGTHSYPFSYLVPGSIPSTCSLGAHSETTVKYELVAVVTYLDPHNNSKSTNSATSSSIASSKKQQKFLQLAMPVPITRSIPRGPDKNSLRVFPPTELTAAAVLPNVVYPKSTFPLELKLDGVSSGDRRWRMRKLAWRIEETTKVRGNSCKDHKRQLNHLEKEIKKKEIERSKKPAQAIKRYGDIGPQIKVTVASPENIPSPALSQTQPLNTQNNNTNRNSAGSTTSNSQSTSAARIAPRRTANANGLQDADDDDDAADADSLFVHPSDDALRQEILQQQQRIREEQLRKEFAKNNSMLFTEEVRILNKGEMKSGWKTDFENNGKIELVTDIDCMSLNSGVSNPVMFSSTTNPFVTPHKQPISIACDIQDPNLGIYVSHILAVEIVVAEETLQYSNGQPISRSKTNKSNGKVSNSNASPSPTRESNNADQRLAELSPMFANRNAPKIRQINNEEDSHLSPSTSRNNDGSGTNASGSSTQNSPRIVSVPTGAARVLRMQFRLNVTERSGLGISWDEEVPPIYQDVKHTAPPTYENTISQVPAYMRRKKDDPESMLEDSDLESNTSTSVIPVRITPPPMAYHGSSSGSGNPSALSTVQSPQLDSVSSIQGSVPYRNSILTPAATRDYGIRNVSEILDTDRITQ